MKINIKLKYNCSLTKFFKFKKKKLMFNIYFLILIFFFINRNPLVIIFAKKSNLF